MWPATQFPTINETIATMVADWKDEGDNNCSFQQYVYEAGIFLTPYHAELIVYEFGYNDAMKLWQETVDGHGVDMKELGFTVMAHIFEEEGIEGNFL